MDDSKRRALIEALKVLRNVLTSTSEELPFGRKIRLISTGTRPDIKDFPGVAAVRRAIDAVNAALTDENHFLDVEIAPLAQLSKIQDFTNEVELLPGLPADSETLETLDRLIRHLGGKPAVTSIPLIEAHQQAFDLICREGPLTGKQIVTKLALTSQSLFTGHYVPELKLHGIRNRRGLGYYHPDLYKPDEASGGKR